MKVLVFRPLAIACLCAIPSIFADSGSWTPAATDLMWDNNANWSGATFPNGAGQAAAFIGAPGTSYVDTTTDITIASLHFDVPGNSISVAFTNNKLIMDNGSDYATISTSGGQTHFMDTDIELHSALSINATRSSSIYFTKPITGDAGVTVLTDMNTHLNFGAENTYTGGTLIQSGFIDLVGPGSTKNLSDSVIVLGSGNISHDPTVSDNYAAGTRMTVIGGNIYMRGTTQTLERIVMTKEAMIVGPEVSSLVLTGTDIPTFVISGDSKVFADSIVLANGGGIINDSSMPGAGYFWGSNTATGFMTIDLNSHPTDVRINADFNNNSAVALYFNNVQFINGTLEKTGAGTILLDGESSQIPDLNIVNGTVQIGAPFGPTAIVSGDTTVTIREGATLQGFGTLGVGGNATVITETNGAILPGAPFMPGTFTISGDYQHTSSARMYIQGFGASNINKLIVTDGTVSLDGSFYFLAVPSTPFAAGDEFVVIDNPGGAITGTFSSFGADLPAGLSASLIYDTTQVRLLLSACEAAPACLLSPTDLHVTTLVNNCFDRNDYVHRLTWTASPSSGVARYAVYINGSVAGVVSTFQPLVFNHHYDPTLGETYEYMVTAITINGEESAGIIETV